MRRKKTKMTANRHLHNILGGLRRRGMDVYERDRVKRWLGGLAEFSCYYCGDKLKPTTYSVDHRSPLFKGGVNTLENLAVCCKKCNCQKGSLSERDFIQLLKDMVFLSPDGQKNVLARLRAAGKWYRR